MSKAYQADCQISRPTNGRCVARNLNEPLELFPFHRLILEGAYGSAGAQELHGLVSVDLQILFDQRAAFSRHLGMIRRPVGTDCDAMSAVVADLFASRHDFICEAFQSISTLVHRRPCQDTTA